MQPYITANASAKEFDEATDVPQEMQPTKAVRDALFRRQFDDWAAFCEWVPDSLGGVVVKLQEAASAIAAGPVEEYDEGEALAAEVRQLADMVAGARQEPALASRLRAALALREASIKELARSYPLAEGDNAITLLRTALQALRPRLV